MIELSRAQDEEVGDGTTSVIILAGEMLTTVESFLEKDIHPPSIVAAYFKALDEVQKIAEESGVPIDIEKEEDIANIRAELFKKEGEHREVGKDCQKCRVHLSTVHAQEEQLQVQQSTISEQ